MLDFIKNLFKKEGEEAQQVRFEELQPWFEEKANQYYSESNSKISEAGAGIKDIMQKLAKDIENLNSAELHNPNISIREKQFMEGNREAYIRRTKLLIEGIYPPENVKDVDKFYSNLEGQMNEFKKSALRPYQILQNFFSNETGIIHHNLRRIEDIAKDINEIAKEERILKIESARKKIDESYKLIERKKAIESEIAEKEGQLKEIGIELKEDDKKIKELHKSKEYSAYSKKSEELKKIKEKIRLKESDLVSKFSALEKAMKKFSKVTVDDVEIIESYLENPVSALISDSELKIMHILDKLENCIVKECIELKDKKKEKSLKMITKLNGDFFDKFLSEYNEMTYKKDGMFKAINDSNVRKVVYDVENNMTNKKDKLGRIENEISGLNLEVSKIDIGQIKKELSEEIKTITEEDVVIK